MRKMGLPPGRKMMRIKKRESVCSVHCAGRGCSGICILYDFTWNASLYSSSYNRNPSKLGVLWKIILFLGKTMFFSLWQDHPQNFCGWVVWTDGIYKNKICFKIFRFLWFNCPIKGITTEAQQKLDSYSFVSSRSSMIHTNSPAWRVYCALHTPHEQLSWLRCVNSGTGHKDTKTKQQSNFCRKSLQLFPCCGRFVRLRETW